MKDTYRAFSRAQQSNIQEDLGLSASHSEWEPLENKEEYEQTENWNFGVAELITEPCIPLPQNFNDIDLYSSFEYF